MTLQVAVRRQGLDQIAEHIVQVHALLALDGADIEARETQTTGDFAYQFQLGHQSIDRRNRQLALVQQLVIRFDCIHIVVGGARSIALRGQAQRHQRLVIAASQVVAARSLAGHQVHIPQHRFCST